jgi:hypothetical protein
MAKRPVKFDKAGRIWCMGCQTYLAPRFFGRYNGDTPPARCRKCRSKANHDTRLRSTYDITPEAYAMLLEEQGGVCAICQRPSKVRRLAVDHDHATGKVRGLLCRHCNYELIGWYKEDVATFLRAIYYLNDPPLNRIARGVSDPRDAIPSSTPKEQT